MAINFRRCLQRISRQIRRAPLQNRRNVALLWRNTDNSFCRFNIDIHRMANRNNRILLNQNHPAATLHLREHPPPTTTQPQLYREQDTAPTAAHP